MPPYTIDRTTCVKALTYPLDHGYDKRTAGVRPSSIVVHSTNGKRGSSFSAEARFLFESAAVSAHYLVGKRGEIVEFLNPRWRAWHAGTAIPAFDNSHSIGVENHHAVGEAWTDAQRSALTWLVQQLMGEWGIAAEQIETHRAIALPPGRKQDPSDWSDADFYAWRMTLGATTVWYRARFQQAVLEAPRADGAIALAGTAALNAGERIQIDEIRDDGWAHLSNGLGFVPVAILERG